MDCKKELKKKLSESYGRMMKLWMARTPSQLVEAAGEIAAARFIHDGLTNAITEGDAEFLLRYEDPLAVLRDKWIEENGAMMAHDDGLAHCIESLSAQQAEEGGPVTVREFLASHPGASFQMMTPGGYVSLTRSRPRAFWPGRAPPDIRAVRGTAWRSPPRNCSRNMWAAIGWSAASGFRVPMPRNWYRKPASARGVTQC